MIEPVIEALTTSSSPWRIRKKAMIISVTLPNVAFSKPPTWGPERAARSSVAWPINPASGRIARAEDDEDRDARRRA